jgi:hypothetical protein
VCNNAAVTGILTICHVNRLFTPSFALFTDRCGTIVSNRVEPFSCRLRLIDACSPERALSISHCAVSDDGVQGSPHVAP